MTDHPTYRGGPHMPLTTAKAWLREQVTEGTGAVCPCCGQLAKQYRRKLNAGMARALVAMYRAHGIVWQDKTVTLAGFGSAARDESLLRHWGLLEEHDASRPDGGRPGWWRVTPTGARFARGMTTVPSHIVIYNNAFRGYTGDPVTIRECLGSRFDLDELLAAA